MKELDVNCSIIQAMKLLSEYGNRSRKEWNNVDLTLHKTMAVSRRVDKTLIDALQNATYDNDYDAVRNWMIPILYHDNVFIVIRNSIASEISQNE